MTLMAIHWHTIATVLVVIAIILVVLMALMYFYGKKLSRQQAEQQPIIDANTQNVSMLIVDKKKLSIEDAITAGLPEAIKEQTPFYLKWQKLPVVKAKIGPRVMTLISDPTVFEQIPKGKECKCSISGLYIRAIKSVRGGSIPKAPEKKKGIWAHAKAIATGK